MGCICGDVGKKRLLRCPLLFHPAKSGSEEDVCAETVRLNETTVMTNDGIQILIVGGIGTGTIIGLAYPPGAMNEDLVKPTLIGLVFVFVAEVPFSKDARSVPCSLQYLRQDGCLQCHPLPFLYGMCDPVFFRVTPRHDGGSSGRAGWRHEEPTETGTCIMQSIQMGRLEPWMSVSTDRCITLIIRDDQNDVRLTSSFRCCGRDRSDATQNGDQPRKNT